ncbi:MAG: HAMP domain-containing histidine kinase [Campylobacterales bacterium]|nr:HAMP domain-containing histidine kinase [Campylobacterales bacterium]
MSIKKKDFIFSNSIVVVFTILIVLILNNFLTSKFGFTQESFFPITVLLVAVGIFLYNFLSRQLLEPLFQSEQKIQDKIKQTLHELNTPVATILANTKMIRKKCEEPKNIARIDRIEQSCQNLLELYNQMEYDIKTHIDNVAVETFDISGVILKSIAKFDDIKNGISIDFQPSFFQIVADKNGFERVLDNLISNAIKYNKPNGSIRIYLENNKLFVKDSGIGIDTKDLFSVFDKYFQGDSLNQGVGLGLNIVKSYCDHYKISVQIDSQLDIGTTFVLDLSLIKSGN